MTVTIEMFELAEVEGRRVDVTRMPEEAVSMTVAVMGSWVLVEDDAEEELEVVVDEAGDEENEEEASEGEEEGGGAGEAEDEDEGTRELAVVAEAGRVAVVGARDAEREEEEREGEAVRVALGVGLADETGGFVAVASWPLPFPTAPPEPLLEEGDEGDEAAPKPSISNGPTWV